MRYPIAIEPGGDAEAFGVVVPDLPGCFSAGDTRAEAVAAAREAVAAWMEATLDAGGTIPPPSTLDDLRADSAFLGWTFATVEIDLDSDAVQRHAGTA